MAKLIYEAVVKVIIDADDDADLEVIEGALAERLTELADVDKGTVVVTDLKLTLKDAK